MSEYKDRAAYFDLVRRYVSEAERDPEGFSKLAQRTISRGYWVSALIFVGSLAAVGGLAWMTFSWQKRPSAGPAALGLFFLAIPYNLLVTLLRPSVDDRGIKVSPSEAPKLWAETERICRHLGAPPVDEIRLGLDLNASAGQAPRFGVFGKLKNVLYIGLPLQALLTPEELRAVIAHEFGHFARKHGVVSSHVHAMCSAWREVSASSGLAASMMRPILQVQSRRLGAMDAALRLSNEYEADRAGTAIAGRAAVTGILRAAASYSAIQMRNERMSEEMVKSGATHSDIVGRLLGNARSPIPEHELAQALDEAFRTTQRNDASHPAYLDRIAAMGEPRPSDIGEAARSYAAELSATGDERAIDVLFTPAELSTIQQRLTENSDERWSEHFAREHSRASAEGELTDEDASSAEGLEGPELAALLTRLMRREMPDLEPIAARVLEQDPGHPSALIVRAQGRRQTDPAGAIADLEKAAVGPGEFQTWCLGQALEIAETERDQGTAERLYHLLQQASEAEQYFEMEIMGDLAEARAWTVPDVWHSQALEVLAKSRDIAEVYAVEFPSRVWPGATHRYLYIVPRFKSWRLESAIEARIMREALPIHAPWVMVDFRRRSIVSRLRPIVGAKFYSA